MADSSHQKISLSIIILNYKTDDATYNLASKLSQVEHAEIIIVDNSSSPELKHNIEKVSNGFYIDPEKNLGFAGGVNEGYKNAKGAWIMLLNSDIVTDEKAVQKLVALAEQVHAQVAVPKLISSADVQEANVGNFPRLFTHPVDWLFGRPQAFKPTSDTTVHYTTGAALLIKRSTIETVGLFDSRFFMYFEDLDLGMRLHQAGIPINFISSIVMRHQSGGSADADPKQKNTNYQTSLYLYLRKHRGIFIAWLNSVLKALR